MPSFLPACDTAAAGCAAPSCFAQSFALCIYNITDFRRCQQAFCTKIRRFVCVLCYSAAQFLRITPSKNRNSAQFSHRLANPPVLAYFSQHRTPAIPASQPENGIGDNRLQRCDNMTMQMILKYIAQTGQMWYNCNQYKAQPFAQSSIFRQRRKGSTAQSRCRCAGGFVRCCQNQTKQKTG